MFLIAHRGLIDGPDSTKENHPSTIIRALDEGFDVELDLNIIDNIPILGHDNPQYEVSLDFLRKKGLWIHAKTIQSLEFCVYNLSETNFFFHQEDPCVLTSHSWIWTHPNTSLLTNKSIAVVPEKVMSLEQIKTLRCAGICSDYVKICKG